MKVYAVIWIKVSGWGRFVKCKNVSNIEGVDDTAQRPRVALKTYGGDTLRYVMLDGKLRIMRMRSVKISYWECWKDQIKRPYLSKRWMTPSPKVQRHNHAFSSRHKCPSELLAPADIIEKQLQKLRRSALFQNENFGFSDLIIHKAATKMVGMILRRLTVGLQSLQV